MWTSTKIGEKKLRVTVRTMEVELKGVTRKDKVANTITI